MIEYPRESVCWPISEAPLRSSAARAPDPNGRGRRSECFIMATPDAICRLNYILRLSGRPEFMAQAHNGAGAEATVGELDDGT
jgi:hypothetical protein